MRPIFDILLLVLLVIMLALEAVMLFNGMWQKRGSFRTRCPSCQSRQLKTVSKMLDCLTHPGWHWYEWAVSYHLCTACGERLRMNYGTLQPASDLQWELCVVLRPVRTGKTHEKRSSPINNIQQPEATRNTGPLASPADFAIQLSALDLLGIRSQFVTYTEQQVSSLRISEQDKQLLVQSGLPADASSFLSFDCKTRPALKPHDEFPSSIVIGSNGSGDQICLDQDTQGQVVYYFHDNHMLRVYMNSSLMTFAQCLCWFYEFCETREEELFRSRVMALDSAALHQEAFWSQELRMMEYDDH